MTFQWFMDQVLAGIPFIIVSDFPRPGTVKELQAFLGTVNFYQRFMASAAGVLLLLTAALKGSHKDDHHLVWTDRMASVFLAAKDRLQWATGLAFP